MAPSRATRPRGTDHQLTPRPRNVGQPRHHPHHLRLPGGGPEVEHEVFAREEYPERSILGTASLPARARLRHVDNCQRDTP